MRVLATMVVVSLLGGCAGRSIEGGTVLSPGSAARLDVRGRGAEILIRNGGSEPLGVEVGSGATPPVRDSIDPGVTRWWNPDGPRTYRLVNSSVRPLAVSYRVRGGGATFEPPADRP
ncbi:MAG: hypothetical protein JNM80_03810 [Phycisphaerae bacterium]|nr:hypothetical protein [Phycisphaerae bacterium]